MGLLQSLIIKRWILLTATVVLSACGEADRADLVDFVENAHKDRKPEIEPLPEIRLYEKFVYSASNLSDPFATSNLLPSSSGGGATGGTGPDTNRRLEPLEKFSLADLMLVGTIQHSGELWVIIKAPDGTVHSVTTGDHVGDNFGRVVKIANSRVELIEMILADGNRWVERGAFLSFGGTGDQYQ